MRSSSRFLICPDPAHRLALISSVTMTILLLVVSAWRCLHRYEFVVQRRWFRSNLTEMRLGFDAEWFFTSLLWSSLGTGLLVYVVVWLVVVWLTGRPVSAQSFPDGEVFDLPETSYSRTTPLAQLPQENRSIDRSRTNRRRLRGPDDWSRN